MEKKKSSKKSRLKENTIDTEKIEGKNREIYWIIGAMIIAILILLLIPSISKEMNTFKYKGLVFTKERFGQLPVFHHYYFFSDSAKQNYQYNLYLKEDPRKNNVSVEGVIEYSPAGSEVFVSVDGVAMKKCKDSLRDIATLASFLGDNLFDVKSGYPDKEIAKENNLTYVDCSTHPNNIVILIKEGNETKIIKQNNCYLINVANCQVLSAIEKFEVQSVIDAKMRAKKIR